MALHLVRHAEAGPSPEELTGLTSAGHRQALRVADLLSAVPVARILSSRYQRCVETISPLAERLDLRIEEHPALCEEAVVDKTWVLLESLTRHDVVVCTHGNLLGPVLDRILRRGAEVVAEEWSIRKASVWRLDSEPDRPFARATLLG
jgi:8-oxo-dGTP diphosphatase